MEYINAGFQELLLELADDEDGISSTSSWDKGKLHFINVNPLPNERVPNSLHDYQMAVPLLEQCVDYDKVMSHGKIKESITLIVLLTIPESSVYFFKSSEDTPT